MTRINTVKPARLTDQHLLAEYRELNRIFGKAYPNAKAPKRYTMGEGHVLFFYSRTTWLSRRQAELIAECQRRGFEIQFTVPRPPVPGCDGDWEPDADDEAVSLGRLRERLAEKHAKKPGWYTWYGAAVGDDFYGRVS